MLLAVGPPDISNPDLPVSSVDSAPLAPREGPHHSEGQSGGQATTGLEAPIAPREAAGVPTQGPAADSQHSRGNLISSLTLLTCKMGRWPRDNGDWAAGTGLASLRASMEEGGW